MLERILSGTEADREELRRMLGATRRRSDEGLVARVEAEVARDPRETITFDHEVMATVRAEGREYVGGRFTTPSMKELRERAKRLCAQAGRVAGPAGPAGSAGWAGPAGSAGPVGLAGPAGTLRLWVLEGPDRRDPLTDIGSLQGWTEGGTAFQVASQFNALEAPDPCLVPVHRYAFDPTQGPRAAFSAFPAALVRHYAAPAPGPGPAVAPRSALTPGPGSGVEPAGRFVQRQDGPQVDLLGDAIPAALGRVTNGYLLTDSLGDLAAAAEALEERFDRIRVGLHEGAEVVFGHGFFGEARPGAAVTQCLTSTLALGGYSERGLGPKGARDVERLCRTLLRGAYLGTLLGAAVAGDGRVLLTLIGGGAFGNPLPLIRESILWALGEAAPLLPADLDVIVNARDNVEAMGRGALEEAVAAHGGRWVRI